MAPKAVKADEKELILSTVEEVLTQYGGMKLTLRQIFYRLVAKGVIVNSEQSYKKIIRMMTEARKSKRIPYTAIEDRTRSVHVGSRGERSVKSHFTNALEYFKKLDEYYSLPRWWGQKTKVVVFVEKEALASLFERVTDELEVDLIVCRGYPSLTLMYEVAQHIKWKLPPGIENIVFLYFGDFDPSGADIERHVEEELKTTFRLSFDISRIAITMAQIEEYNIPPAPAKTTDTRTAGFEAEHGVAWQVELDAIEPENLQKMIRDAIDAHFDEDIEVRKDEELEMRKEEIRSLVKEALTSEFADEDEDESDDEED